MTRSLTATILYAAVTAVLIGQLACPEEVAAAVHQTCTDCHTENNRLIMADVNDLCLSCHPSNMTDHRIGIVPRGEPTDLPLSTAGAITCITCHEPHGETAHASLLRAEKDKICLKCHDK